MAAQSACTLRKDIIRTRKSEAVDPRPPDYSDMQMECVDSINIVLKGLACLPTSLHFKRKLLLAKFVLSDEVLKPNTIVVQEQSKLLQLPYEVQLLIFDTLGHAPSQVALALTCRQLGEVAQHVTLARSQYSPKYAGKLPRESFDIPELMQQLVPWVPKNLKLCDHCLTYRPCDPEYWKNVDSCGGVSTFWVQKVGWTFAMGWQKEMHNICPYCHINCSLSDYVECDGCRATGRWGDIDFRSLGTSHRARTEAALRNGTFAT